VGSDNNTTISISPVEIYNQILKKYQTGQNLYVYIQGEYGRSYNYYNSTRTVSGFNSGTNETLGWPLLIKKISQDSNEDVYGTQSIGLVNIFSEPITNFDIDIWSFNGKIEKDNLDQTSPLYPQNLNIKTYQFHVKMPSVYSSNIFARPATFYMVFINADQGLDYYNYLWPANIKNGISVGNNINYSWFTFDKNRMVNLDILSCGVAVQNKVVCYQKQEQEQNVIKQRLYMAIIKSNTKHDARTNTLNTHKVTEGFKDNIAKEKYCETLYNDSNFCMLKGRSNKGLNYIDSLAFTNEENPFSVKSYFQLGITEGEYQQLKILLSSSNEIGCNAFFYLNKEGGNDLSSFQKFKLGIRYEISENNTSGLVISMSDPVYPAEFIYVYTLDGFFFFSPDFDIEQNFINKSTNCKVTFERRPNSNNYAYLGEFGFDWMRLEDTTISGNVNYRDIIGTLYQDATYNNPVTDGNIYNGYFKQKDSEFYKLEQEYDMYFILPTNVIEKYYIPQLSLYPPYVDSSDAPEKNSVFGPHTNFATFCDKNRVAHLIVRTNYGNSNSTSIKLEYDKTLFNITYDNGNQVSVIANNSIITIRCIAQFDKDQIIYAVDNNNVVGRFQVKANSKPNRYSKKVLVVGVTTNIAGHLTDTAWNNAKKEQMKILMLFLRQVLITPVIETVSDISLNSTLDTNDAKFFHFASGDTYILIKDNTNSLLEDYLFSKIPEDSSNTVSNSEKYKDYFKVFLFDTTRVAPDSSATTIGGHSNGIDKIIVFTSYNTVNSTLNNKETIAHEFLHLAGVDHTFANASPHTFKPFATGNIMDYPDLETTDLIQRLSIFNWQGAIAKKRMDPDPQEDPS
jgi:hypothetical protein